MNKVKIFVALQAVYNVEMKILILMSVLKIFPLKYLTVRVANANLTIIA